MALPDFSMRQLLEAGVHFGHQPHLWNPKMGTYIFGARNSIHIMDLSQTVPLLHQALWSRFLTSSLEAVACCLSAPSVRRPILLPTVPSAAPNITLIIVGSGAP